MKKVYLAITFSFFVVAALAESTLNSYEILKRHLASRRLQRRVRSEPASLPTPISSETEKRTSLTSTLSRPELLNFTLDETISVPSSSSNSSFLFDLPYPSHFLFSLQLLNISLPFIGDGVHVPDDPPTPKFEFQEVLNNNQFFQPIENGKNGKTPLETGLKLRNPNANFTPSRRSVNRVRNRIPSHLRHLPKRSVELKHLQQGKGLVYSRQRNATDDASIRRRQEFHAKLRAPTTSKPYPTIKKLLHRRANSTKSLKPKSVIEQRGTSSIIPEQVSASSRQYESSFKKSALVLNDSEFERSKISGFRLSGDRSTSRPIFNTKPRQISSGFVPFIPQEHATKKEEETSIIPFLPRLSTPSKSFQSKEKTIDSFSQLEISLNKNLDKEHDTIIVSRSEISQVKNPDTLIQPIKTETSPFLKDVLAPNTSVFQPVPDVYLNLTFPNFELPNPDGTRPSPPSLPPPLSIEELIKKFTGKDPITDSPILGRVPPTSLPNNLAHPSHVSFTTDGTISQASNSNSSFTPDYKAIENLEATLKQLIISTPKPNDNESNGQLAFLDTDRTSSTERPSLVENLSQIPPPSKESSIATTEASPYLSQSFSLPTFGSSGNEPEIKKTAISEFSVSTLPPEIYLSKTPTFNSTVVPVTNNQSLFVQRGPLDVSALDTSVASGFSTGSGISQGGFHPAGQQPIEFNTQSVNFQQQHQPPGSNFQGLSAGSFGGADIVAGQQNPFYYSGFPTASSPGQLYQTGFDGLLHYSPTGPPAGEFNAITQGLSLLASFGGGGVTPGGQPHFTIQQPTSFQQTPTYADFSSASLQAASQVQTTVNLPSQGLYSLYSPLNIIQSQPQASYQLAPNQQQPHPYQYVQAHSYHTASQPPPQHIYSQGIQQPFQTATSIAPSSGIHLSQPIQVHSQSAGLQPSGSTAQLGSSQYNAINPAQFGTLLSGSVPSSSASESTGASSGATSTGSVSGSSRENARADKISAGSSASEIVEIQLKPESQQSANDGVSSASGQVVNLISIGPENLHSVKSSKKSYFKRGLRSGYYF